MPWRNRTTSYANDILGHFPATLVGTEAVKEKHDVFQTPVAKPHWTLKLRPVTEKKSLLQAFIHRITACSPSFISTVIPVVPALPWNTNLVKHCFLLFWLHNGRRASFKLLSFYFPEQIQYCTEKHSEIEVLLRTSPYADGVILLQPLHCTHCIYFRMVSFSERTVCCQFK